MSHLHLKFAWLFYLSFSALFKHLTSQSIDYQCYPQEDGSKVCCKTGTLRCYFITGHSAITESYTQDCASNFLLVPAGHSTPLCKDISYCSGMNRDTGKNDFLDIFSNILIFFRMCVSQG